MIQCQRVAFSAENLSRLQKWLEEPGASIAITAAEARVKELQVAALGDALKCSQGKPLKIESANRNREVAAKCAAFLEVMREMKNPGTEFFNVKLT